MGTFSDLSESDHEYKLDIFKHGKLYWMDIVDLVVFGLVFRFIMLDDLRDVTKVVNHFLRNANAVLPALVDILFRVILT